MKNEILLKCKVEDNVKDVIKVAKIDNAEKEKVELPLFSELCRADFKDNTFILNRYFRNKEKHACAFANLFYFEDRLKSGELTMYSVKKIIAKDFGYELSLKGYNSDPSHYRFCDLFLQLEYEEDELWKEKVRELQEHYSNDRVEELDLSAVSKLYDIVLKALKNRMLILLNLESAINLINNAYDCYYKGLSCGSLNTAINSKLTELRHVLEDREVVEWLKTGVSDMSLYTDEIMLNGYISTYQKVLRQLTEIRGERLDYVKDLVHNEFDIFEEEILANTEDDIEPLSYLGSSVRDDTEEDNY